jgi:hypothetical protein
MKTQVREWPMPAIDNLGKRLGEYQNWRDELAELIAEYQTWVENQGLASGEDDLRIYELLDSLRADKLTVALVAEFSRGKTELINAIFFADYRQRLLPSEAGRTTMCPTELCYDERQPPSLRLLPIETRKTSTTLAEYKRATTYWTTLPLELDSPRQMSETFRELVKTKYVPAREAETLGLYDPRNPDHAAALTPDGRVAVPVWRHAIINYPHPLLKKGLVVLDTPGLNALGAEPELTLAMIPAAQAVLFVLAADTGVTKSDLDVWNNHVGAARRRAGAAADGHLVVLNKIDILWDELRSEEAIHHMLARQIEETARHLGVPPAQIFPVSAAKGLVGKIKNDLALLARSGLPALEARLATDLVGSKQRLLRERVKREIGAIIETTRAMIESRLKALSDQLVELKTLSGKSHDAIQQLLTRIREEKQAYDRTLASFQTTRAVLSDQIRILLDYLSVEAFDALAAKARRDMNEAWTTHGLKIGMKSLFDGVLEAMEKAHKQAQQIRALVQAIYNKFHTDHGLARIDPEPLSLDGFRTRLLQLYAEAEAYRKSPIMVMTEQHFVVKKFFITMVSRTRELFAEANTASKNWSKAVMAPILAQVREHKIMMDQRLANLKRVHENLDNLTDRIAELEANKQNHENQLLVIRNMLRKLDQPLALDN